ncbi:hypothetical protein B0H11DRAFT_914217 [Mycena galericulata]|nr:hypothetical protein B0H11DRAFT_914217 [Mycena galericulata]
MHLPTAVVTACNLTMVDDVSGILGLGFPRLSGIPSSVTNCACISRPEPRFADAVEATPFFPSLAQQGVLDYPLFGLSLTNNASGSLSLGMPFNLTLPILLNDFIGAIDTNIVTNVSNIGWNTVVEFSPVASESNTSSYLYWATVFSSVPFFLITASDRYQASGFFCSTSICF